MKNNYKIKVKHLLFIVTLTCTNILLSQDLEVKWSEQMEYENSFDGFFSNYLGANTSFIYTFFTNNISEGQSIKKIKIVVFDKTTLEKVTSIALKGFDENKGSITEDLSYYKTIIQDNYISVFWTKITKTGEELYVQRFDSKLKALKDITKIKTINSPTGMKRSVLNKNSSSFVVFGNNKNDEKIIIGWEVPQLNSFVKFNYTELNSELNLIGQKEVVLPFKLNDVYYGTMGVYNYLENGDLSIVSKLTAENKGNTDKIIHGGIKLTKLNFNTTLSYIKTAEGEIAYTELPPMDIYDIPKQNYLLTDDNKFCYYSTYSDLNIDPKGKIIHGILKFELDISSMEKKEIELVSFEKSIFDKLYQTDIVKDGYNSCSIKIDSVIKTNKNDVVLILSLHNNNGTMITSCGKNRFTFIKMNETQEILWTQEIEQYSNELRILSNSEELIPLYSVLSFDSKKSPLRSTCTDIVGYSKINFESGKIEIGKDFDLYKGAKILDTYFPTTRIIENKLYINYININKEEGHIGNISILN